MTLDMTRGKPTWLLLRFALPMMVSSLLQQMYTLCDSFIVGRLLGTAAFAATASASNLNWFPLNMLLGAVSGFGVSLAQSFGAGTREDFQRFFAGSILLSIVLGITFSVLGFAGAEFFLIQLYTPAELLDFALRYIRVLWIGFSVTAILNIFTSALLAMGDSKTPLVALAVSSAVNIVLDVALIAWFHMDVEGAALATLLAQGAAAVWSFLGLCRRKNMLPRYSDFRPDRRIFKELLRLGLPQILCNGVTTSGELIIHAAVNSCGVAFVTGLTASHRYLNLLSVVNYGLEGAVATYVGQNWGAQQYDRIQMGTRCAVRMGIFASMATALTVCLLAEPMIRFFVPDAAAEAIRYGTEALQVQAAFLPALYLLCEYRAAIRAMGNAVIPMFSGFLELAMRVGCTLLLPLLIGQYGLYFTDAAAWVPTMLMLFGFYQLLRSKIIRQKI